jgi:cell division protein FtsI (penicillin-binding protein 3)
VTTSPSIFQKRIVIAAAFSVAAFALVGIRLIDVTLLGGAISGQPSKAPAEHFARADLRDRNGVILARDLPVTDVGARPEYFWDKRQAAHDLAVATGANEEHLAKLFAKKKYVLVAQRVTPDTLDKVMATGLPALDLMSQRKRYYPMGREAAQVIGVTEPDGHGISGLEMGLDKNLSDANTPIVTSIDARVQFILAHELTQALKDYSAKSVGGIVMDVNTGEVLAMASLPDFDPNARGAGREDSTRNVMAQDRYELGSVFKVFAFTLAVEDHTTRMDEFFPIAAGFHIGNHTIHDAEKLPAMMMAKDILAESSNVGTAQIALRSGPTRQKAFLKSLGLLDLLKTELPERRGPSYPSNWGMTETATIGFGHGISISPLSFVSAAASVVNGGRKITPTFLEHPVDSRGAQVIKPDTSLQMRDLLRYDVTNGTGRNADVPGYDVGGKTGSAEKNENGHYVAHKLLTSFCAVFPVHDPRYIVFVMIDEPHGQKASGVMALAGHTAAPVAGRVIARIAPLLGVPRAPVVVADAHGQT